MSGVAAEDADLIFRWEPARRRIGVIVTCLVGSALLHAFGFYLFQIIYPPTVSVLPPPARVTLISPTNEEGRVLLRWIAAEDPALAVTTQRPPGADTLDVPRIAHEPTFAHHEPALKELPPYNSSVAVDANPPAPVATVQPAQASSLPVLPTRIAFGAEISARTAELPALKFVRSRTTTPETAQFRIAVNAEGEVRYSFVVESSGDSALDEQARQVLARTRFEPNESSALTWTTATIEWGNDIAGAATSPAAAFATP